MDKRIFQLRLTASYEGAENKIDQLGVEVLHDGEWETLELDIRSPGFLLFINGLFSCQHLYMRTNSAERGIQLASATGELKVVTDINWVIQHAGVSFSAQKIAGEVTEDALAYIVERMHHCPVSSNLPDGLRLEVSVDYT